MTKSVQIRGRPSVRRDGMGQLVLDDVCWEGKGVERTMLRKNDVAPRIRAAALHLPRDIAYVIPYLMRGPYALMYGDELCHEAPGW